MTEIPDKPFGEQDKVDIGYHNVEPKFEEIKPNFWVRKTKKGRYVQVFPIKKNPNLKNLKGNINWRNLIFGGQINITLFFIIILIISFAYWNDVKTYKDYYEKTQPYLINMTPFVCTQDLQNKGLCINPNNNLTINRNLTNESISIKEGG